MENTWHAYNARSTTKGNLLMSPNHQTTKIVVERANEKVDEKLHRLIIITDYAAILWIGEFLQTWPA